MSNGSAVSSGVNNVRPQPMLTFKEATRSGLCSKETWLETEPLWRLATQHHMTLLTPRGEWEPPASITAQLTEKYTLAGEDEQAIRIATDVEFMLGDMQKRIKDARDLVTKREDERAIFETVETNTTHGLEESVRIARADDDKITAESDQGLDHHARSPQWLKVQGLAAPWVESVGFLFFVSYYINVNLLDPWADPLGWTFTMAVVVIIIIGQRWLVDHAARAHNLLREQLAEGQRSEAVKSERNRGWYLAEASVTAAAITGGMIQRGLASVGEDAGIWVTVIMTVLATTVGLLLPTLAYLAQALDGSKVARRRDALAADLDDHKAGVEDDIAAAKQLLDVAAETQRELEEQMFPEIVSDVQDAVNEAHVPYNFLRIQIGGLVADPPVKKSAPLNPDFTKDEVSCGLPGAAGVSLRPLGDAKARLDAIANEAATLRVRIERLTPHPWGEE